MTTTAAAPGAVQGGPGDPARAQQPVVAQAGEVRSARVESLRALAALGVLVGHAYGWAHGFRPEIYQSFGGRLLLGGGLGVFLFFSLSGYLLFLPFARVACGTAARQVRIGRYAANRALRVLPLYYVVIATYLALDGGPLRHEWWRFATLTPSFWNDSVARVDGPVWSLIVEVQFYALLPIVAWGVTLLARRSAARAALVVGALGVALLALRLHTVTFATPSAVWRYSLPATAVFFVPGMLLAILRARCDVRRPQWMSSGIVARPALWLAASAGLFLLVVDRYNRDALLLPACFLLLGACVLPLADERGLRWLAWRPLSLLGVASYSLYLWHEPIVHALSDASWVPNGTAPLILVSGVICIVVALASYRVIEAPFLRLRRQWQPAGTTPVAHVEPGGARETMPGGHTTTGGSTVTQTLPSRTSTSGEGFVLTGPSTPLRELFTELWRARRIIGVLARKDFFVRYRRTRLGLIWAVALPVVQAVVLAVVFTHIVRAGNAGAVRGGQTTVYAAFVFAGMVPWSYFTAAFSAAGTSVVDSSSLAQRIYFPRLVLPLVAATTAVFPLLFTTVVFLGIVAVLGPGLDVRTLWILPGIALDVALVIGLSSFVSAAQVYLRDIRFAISAAMTVLFYLTPVIYPMARLPESLQQLLQLLPTAGPVELFRMAVGAADPHVMRYVAATVVWTVVVGALGLVVHCKRDRVMTDLL